MFAAGFFPTLIYTFNMNRGGLLAMNETKKLDLSADIKQPQI